MADSEFCRCRASLYTERVSASPGEILKDTWIQSIGSITGSQHGRLKEDGNVLGHGWNGESGAGRMIQVFGSYDSNGRRLIFAGVLRKQFLVAVVI
jgi:hypothetical protein